jgi:hypothetical protein
MTEEPQAIIISTRMGDGQLLGGNIRVRESQLANDCVNVAHCCSCGLTPELSRAAKRLRLE